MSIYVSPGDQPPGREILDQPEMRHYYTDWGKEGDLGYIAVERRSIKPVGAIWMRQFTAEDSGWGFIDEHTPELSMAVLPQFRNAGIGTALLQQLIGVSEATYDSLSLSVDPSNPAIHLYTRFGFFPCGKSGTSITMRRETSGNRKK